MKTIPTPKLPVPLGVLTEIKFIVSNDIQKLPSWAKSALTCKQLGHFYFNIIFSNAVQNKCNIRRGISPIQWIFNQAFRVPMLQHQDICSHSEHWVYPIDAFPAIYGLSKILFMKILLCHSILQVWEVLFGILTSALIMSIKIIDAG